jgi:tetratricopeptide (TPR) repeat protein
MKRMADADRRAVAGDIEGAIAAYRAAIDAEPAGVDARVRLAQILIASGRAAEALEPLAAAAAIAPHEPFLPRKLGNVLESIGRHAEALEAYDAGLARHPDDLGLRAGRWSCLNQLRRLDELLAEAERAVARDPADGAARYARAIACCPQPVENYIAALERELTELPGDPLLQAALAQARAEAASRRAPTD